MTNEQALLTIADALEAAAKIARRAVAAADSAEHAEAAGEVERMLNRARKVHPQLGPRQVRGLEQLQRVWPGGLSTREVRELLDVKHEAGSHQMLMALVEHELAERDETSNPIKYRLGPALRGA
jgi:hypothetical protein